MKTLKLFIGLCFITAFTIYTVKAQNPVKKVEYTANLDGQYYICLNEYLGGDIVFESMEMSHNYIVKLKKGTILGYKDAEGTIPSGNVYEVSQVAPCWPFVENTILISLNGKLVSVCRYSIHTTINANGDITVAIDNWVEGCIN
jgi:hypothetical protein